MRSAAPPDLRVFTPPCRVLACLSLFLTVSVVARSGFWPLPAMSGGVREALGRLPPSEWINGALIAYAFSSFLLGMPRVVEATGAWCGLCHVGYASVFYGLYHLEGSLPENFWAVFVSGLGIFGLEAIGTWARPLAEGAGEGSVG